MSLTKKGLKRILITDVVLSTPIAGTPRILIKKNHFYKIANELLQKFDEFDRLKKQLQIEKARRIVKNNHLKTALKAIKSAEWRISRLESEV